MLLDRISCNRQGWRGWVAAFAGSMLVCASALLPTSTAAQASARIESLVKAGAVDGMRSPSFRAYQASIQEFYAPTAYAAAWVQQGAVSAQGAAMIQLFENAWKKGLDPEDYDASRWPARRESLQKSNGDAGQFDVQLTVSAMRYISDLHVGRVNPRHVGFHLDTAQKKYDLAQFLRERILPATDVSTVLNAIEPPFGAYRRSEAALIQYVELAQRDDGQKLPAPNRPVEPGQTYAGLNQLVARLKLVGDLPPDFAQAGPDQSYGGAVVEGVKRFQRRHGLDADGRLGPTTVRELNVPLADRVHQLQLALERWRWLPTTFDSPPVVVNLPDFRLRALNPDFSVALDMRVIIGKAMNTQSPIFTRDMTFVVFRPYWVVPPGIMRRSIIPSIQKDRNYIANNRYEVITAGGAVVTSGPISDDVLAQLRAGKLMVRQKPGPKNALGLVKMMFPNEFSVYLHSTPSTELFAKSRRDFSSGCIRVEEPAKLAAWVLRNNDGWTQERAQQAMDSGRDDVTVRLAQKVPVFIIYGTAIAYADGEVHFYDDLYGHDKRLTAALAAARSAT
jgi:murein L,D-transpeptidase YcbB/YkuD